MPYAICPQGKPICDHRCLATPCTQGQAIDAWLHWKYSEHNLPEQCKPCQVAEYVQREGAK